MLHIAQERGSSLQPACHAAHRAAGQKLHAHKDAASRSARPRNAPCRNLRRGAAQVVSASPLNEGSTDADVRAAKESGGANEPGVLDNLAGAVRDAAVSAAKSLASAGDPAAAANLQPGILSDSGAEAASFGQPPVAQSDVSMAQPSNGSRPQTAESEDRTVSSGGDAGDTAADPAIVGSQEWLAPQQQLPDQTPPEAGAAAAAAVAAGDSKAQTSSPAAPSPQQDQQQEQRQPPTDQQLDAAVAKLPEAQREAAKRKLRSSWDAKDARGGGGDFLFELGNTDYNTNVDVGATAGLGLDSLFHGNAAFGLGAKSDIADGSLRGFEFRKYDNLYGDYYISPQFLEAITMHIVKNFLADSLGGVRVPVMLGVWGPKGCGKTFMTELAFKKLGVEPIIMSAGELEHEWAGTPGRMIRERYRKAAELSRVRGKLSCLLINDLDAGLGHFKATQTTVNNQNVTGTLMNICDAPTQVSGGGTWREQDFIRRIPIIVTGNDFSTLYAPLIRNGRMEQFYWKPNRQDLLAILLQMYKDDGITQADLEQLLDAFPDQPLDFYGAIRAGTYDNQIRRWIKEDVIKSDINEDADLSQLGARLLKKDRLPVFSTDHVNLEALLAEGRRLRTEQEEVGRQRLSKEYMKSTGKIRQSMIGLSG